MSEIEARKSGFENDLYDLKLVKPAIDKIMEGYDPYDWETKWVYHLLRSSFDGTKSLVWAIRHIAVALGRMSEGQPIPVLYDLLEFFPEVAVHTTPDIQWALAMQGADDKLPSMQLWLKLYKYTSIKYRELWKSSIQKIETGSIDRVKAEELRLSRQKLVKRLITRFNLNDNQKLLVAVNSNMTRLIPLESAIKFTALAFGMAGDPAAIPILRYLLEEFQKLKVKIVDDIQWAINFLSGEYNYKILSEERNNLISKKQIELNYSFATQAAIKAVPGAGYVNDLYDHELVTKIWGRLVVRYNLTGKKEPVWKIMGEYFAGRLSLVWAIRWSVAGLAGLEKGLNLQILNDFYQEYGDIEDAIAREIQWAIALVEAPAEEKVRQIQQRRLELATDFRENAIIWGYVNGFSDWEYLKEFLIDLLKRHGLTDENDPIRKTLETEFAKTNGSVMTAISWAGIALGRLGDQRAIPILREFYAQHPEKAGRVRYKPGDIMLTLDIDYVAWALAMFGEADMLPYMERGVRADNNNYEYGFTKDNYLEAIERIRQKQQPSA